MTAKRYNTLPFPMLPPKTDSSSSPDPDSDMLSSPNSIFPPRVPISSSNVSAALSACLILQNSGVYTHHKRPFAALLLGPDNSTILLTHLSISHVHHAESCLALLASAHYSQAYLWTCTLVSTWEPCAMCTGTIYWANIGRVVFAASEKELSKLTGAGNEENFTMGLPCKDVIAKGQKILEVVGPVPEWEEKVVEESGKWWKGHREKEGG